ncbi:MAG TPA: hypothetical protein VK669_12825 [Candidatus Limnocylindrales bacterium]|nr:hypothetical protein [Candidatus Limnocylindrales bacterium]
MRTRFSPQHAGDALDLHVVLVGERCCAEILAFSPGDVVGVLFVDPVEREALLALKQRWSIGVVDVAFGDDDDALFKRLFAFVLPALLEEIELAAAVRPVDPVVREHDEQRVGGRDFVLQDGIELFIRLDPAYVAPEFRRRRSERTEVEVQMIVERPDETFPQRRSRRPYVVVASVRNENLERQHGRHPKMSL